MNELKPESFYIIEEEDYISVKLVELGLYHNVDISIPEDCL